MIIPILELMKQYNDLIERERKAQTFLESTSIETTEKDKWIPEYRLIINQLNGIFIKLGEFGYKMTDEEIDKGFRQVKFLKL